MMMPANFSVMAENELVYVVGGSAVTDWAKTFNTNLVTIVGNTYVSNLVKGTLGVMFGGNWGGDNGDSIFGSKGILSKIVKYGPTATGSKEINGFNKFMQVVGLSAAVYQLGTANAKTYVTETKVLKA